MTPVIPSRWQNAVLVCRKCTRKVGGGFGKKGKTPLAKALRALGNGKKGRKAAFGIIETGCLKLCPAGAVTVVDGARPQSWLMVKPGADIEEVARELGLIDQPSRPVT